MSTIQKRLTTFLAEFNISAQTFERKSNIGASTASRLSEKSRNITFAKIAKAYPQLNIDWLKTGEGEMLNPVSDKSTHIRQDHNPNSTMFGYVNIDVPEKGKQKILNADGIIVETDTCSMSEQVQHYKAIIDAKDEQIARLLAMLEKKDMTIAQLIEKI